MREQVIAALALLGFVLSPFQVIGQNKDSNDKAWPVLGSTKRISNEDRPRFIIDVLKLELAQSVSRPVSATHCDPTSEGCADWILVSEFFSEWKFDLKKSVLRPDVMMRHYPNALLGARLDASERYHRYLRGSGTGEHYRATGAYVFYLPEQNVFYLYGDCGIGHADGVAGPFAGDPRLVLKKLAIESASK